MGLKRKEYGFTLVELLTVLAIITMLIGLMVPAMTAVRNVARETKQRAQLSTIELALTTFRNDFGDYPRSDWDPASSIDYCGAQKLAEALLGWDLMGFHPQSIWDAIGTAYNPPDENNLRERRGPYLELTTANAFRLEDLFNNTSLLKQDTFVLCDSFGVKRIPIGEKTVRAGTPILYYRANTSSRNIDGPFLNERIYDARNNMPLVDLRTVTPDGTPGKEHPLLMDSYPFPFFYKEYIRDPKVTARLWPYRPNSYILITAGADGLYGTKDDICNF